MNPMLNIAIRAVRVAGDMLMQQIDHVQDLPTTKKSRKDFVNAINKHAEMLIIETLRNAYPSHAFWAEESGQQGTSPYLWIVDPLDGTTNYLHSFPQYAIAIALQHRHQLDQAIVYDPLRQELFTASRGAGAMLNHKRIRVSKQNSLEGALTGISVPDQGQQNKYINAFKTLLPMEANIRYAGATSLDLAYVACGRLDGFWGWGLKRRDTATGGLLIKEAGGMISDPNGHDPCLQGGNIVAANPKVYDKMLKICRADG